jgi:hypothetical protein
MSELQQEAGLQKRLAAVEHTLAALTTWFIFAVSLVAGLLAAGVVRSFAPASMANVFWAAVTLAVVMSLVQIALRRALR